ncbi:unnamed protein product [Cochlearia groenlandica]
MSLFMAEHADLQDITLCVKVLKANRNLMSNQRDFFRKRCTSAMTISDKYWCNSQRYLSQPAIRSGNKGGLVIRDVGEGSIRQVDGDTKVREGSTTQDKGRIFTSKEKGKQPIETNNGSPTSQQKDATDNNNVSANNNVNANQIVIGEDRVPVASITTARIEARLVDNDGNLTKMLKAVEEMLMCVNENNKSIVNSNGPLFETPTKRFGGEDSSQFTPSMESLYWTAHEMRVKNEILARWKELLSTSTVEKFDETSDMDEDSFQPIARSLTFNEEDLDGALQVTLGVAKPITTTLLVNHKPSPMYYNLSSSDNSSYSVRSANDSRPLDIDYHTEEDHVMKRLAEIGHCEYYSSSSTSYPDVPLEIPPQILKYWGESMALEERHSLPNVEVGGPTRASANSTCVLSIYKPVPTVLYNRDVPPYVDVPTEDDKSF